MQNQILQMLKQNQPQQNNLLSILSQLKNAANPQELIQSMPQYQAAMTYIQQNGGDVKTAFYNACSQRGVNPNDILNQIR